MYVRLAFAVAAHLQPEILVVDEVLAVGDASFQKKCLGQDADVASGGRTVLFVSHNMAAISRLCTRGDPAEPWTVVADGPGPKGRRHLRGRDERGEPHRGRFSPSRASPPGSEHVRLLAARLIGDSRARRRVDIRRPPLVAIRLRGADERYALHPNIHLFNEEGTCVFVTSDGYVARTVAESARDLSLHGDDPRQLPVRGNVLGRCRDLDARSRDRARLHERGLLSFSVTIRPKAIRRAASMRWPIPGAVRPMLAVEDRGARVDPEPQGERVR